MYWLEQRSKKADYKELPQNWRSRTHFLLTYSLVKKQLRYQDSVLLTTSRNINNAIHIKRKATLLPA